MTKRIKIYVDGIARIDEKLTYTDISKMLRRKWVHTAIENSNNFVIHIFPQSYVEEYTLSGWSVQYKGKSIVIQLKDCTGKIQEFDIDKIIEKRKLEDNNKKIDLFENVMEQAKSIFLTGEYNDFESAFNHIENRIQYERKKIKTILLNNKEKQIEQKKGN